MAQITIDNSKVPQGCSTCVCHRYTIHGYLNCSLFQAPQRSNALRACSSRQNCRLQMSYNWSSTLKPKVKKFTEKLSLVRRICIDNLIIVIDQVYQLVFWFATALLVTFPYKRRAHLRVKLLEKSRQRKPEVALFFCV